MTKGTCEDLKIFGMALRKRRRAKRLSQEKLATVARIDRTYVSRLEGGKQSASLFTLFKLSHHLECQTRKFDGIMRQRSAVSAPAPGWPLPQQTGERAGGHARLTPPLPPKPERLGTRASRSRTSRRCWESPEPPCTGISPTMLLRESAGLE